LAGEPIFDVNHDGVDDFMMWLRAYSNGDQYFLVINDRQNEDILYFESTNKSCETASDAAYITSDGYNYFLNGNCNLTELTK